MTVLYLESSALLSWINGEPEGERVRTLMDGASLLVTSSLSPLEVRRGLIRRELRREITAAVRNKLLGLLESRLPQWEILDLSKKIRSRASERFPVEPVRTLDAIHLATILEAIKIYPDFEVATLDKRVRENLEPLGLTDAFLS